MSLTYIISIVIILVCIAFYLFWKIKEKGLRGTAIELIVEAERKFDNGNEKMEYCIEKLVALIPMPFSLFITEDMVRKLIQEIFNRIKIALDYNNEK